MIASYSDYLKAKALLEDPSNNFSAGKRAQGEAALKEYEAKYLQDTKDMPLPPEQGVAALQAAKDLPSQEEISQSLSHDAPGRTPEDLSGKLDAGFTPAVASAPAPQAPDASQEWIRGDIDNPNGVITVMDAPLAQVRNALIENPGLLDYLTAGSGMSDQEKQNAVAMLKKGSPLEERYQTQKFQEVADAAQKSGKSVYRYSKAPWLSDNPNASILGGLKAKLGAGMVDAMDKAHAFVLGVDDTAAFGLGQAVAKTGVFDQSDKPGMFQTDESKKRWDAMMAQGKESLHRVHASNDETVGGIPTDIPQAERNDLIKEEHPVAYGAGQVAGTLPVEALSLAPTNALWNGVTGGAVPKTALGKLANGTVRGTAANVASEGVKMGVEAAGNYAKTGDTGISRGEAADRLTGAAEMGLPISLLGAGIHAGSSTFGNWIRGEGENSGRGPYKGLPGIAESMGSEPQFLKGFSTPPAVAEARAMARERGQGVEPIDMIAEQTKYPLREAVVKEERSQRRLVGDLKAEVFRSPEGRQQLPATSLLNEAVDQWEGRTQKGRAVGLPGSNRNARAVINANVERVSVTPVEGARAITPEQAQDLLHPAVQDRVLESAQRNKPVQVTGHDLSTIHNDLAGDMPEGFASVAHEPEAAAELPASNPGEALATVDRYRPGAAQLPSGSSEAIDRLSPMPQGGPKQLPGGEVPAAQATAREASKGLSGEPAPIPDAEFTEGAPPGKPPKERAPGSFAQELRRAGVKKVYLLPRRYDAQRQEEVIRILRTGGGDTTKARAMQDLYHAALRDRDQRTWQGEQGGWSKLQAQNEERVATAKDLRKRVAPKGKAGAYESTIRHGRYGEGKSEDVAAMQRAAELAGGRNPELVQGARLVAPLTELQELSAFGNRTSRGGDRLPWGPSAVTDFALLRGIYPVTRAIEKMPMGGSTVPSRLAQTYREDRREGKKATAEHKAAAATIKPSASSKPAPKRRRYPRLRPQQ